MSELTGAQQRALKWLCERNGAGVLDRYGRLVAGGEVATQFHPTTWLRLVAAGMVNGHEGRLSVTLIGTVLANYKVDVIDPSPAERAVMLEGRDG